MRLFSRYFHLYLLILRGSVMEVMMYRQNFIIWSIVHLLELVVNIAFFQFIFLRTQSIGGWNMFEVLILLGYMELMLGLGGITFYPMMYGFARMVRRGDLDWKLVKPVDAQFLITFPWLDTSDMMSLLTGAILMAYGVIKLGISNPILNISGFIILLVSAEIILGSFITMLITLAFKSPKLDHIENFFWTLQWLGRYPVSVFKGVFHFIFMFIIPVGLTASLPARTLAGVLQSEYFIISIFFAVGLFILSRKLLLKAIGTYSSASS